MFHILCSVFKSSAFHFVLLWVSGSVFRPQGPGSGAQGSRFRVQCPVVRVQDPVSRVQVTGSMVSRFGLRAQVAGFQVGTEFRFQGSWFRISGSGLRLQGSESECEKETEMSTLDATGRGSACSWIRLSPPGTRRPCSLLDGVGVRFFLVLFVRFRVLGLFVYEVALGVFFLCVWLRVES